MNEWNGRRKKKAPHTLDRSTRMAPLIVCAILAIICPFHARGDEDPLEPALHLHLSPCVSPFITLPPILKFVRLLTLIV